MNRLRSRLNGLANSLPTPRNLAIDLTIGFALAYLVAWFFGFAPAISAAGWSAVAATISALTAIYAVSSSERQHRALTRPHVYPSFVFKGQVWTLVLTNSGNSVAIAVKVRLVPDLFAGEHFSDYRGATALLPVGASVFLSTPESKFRGLNILMVKVELSYLAATDDREFHEYFMLAVEAESATFVPGRGIDFKDALSQAYLPPKVPGMITPPPSDRDWPRPAHPSSRQ